MSRTTRTALRRKIDPDLPTGDEVQFRDDDRRVITFPKGMTYSKALEILTSLRDAQETESVFSQTFPYRPYDGAVATAIVLKSRYGIVMGKEIQGMFSSQPPELITVPTGPGGQSVQVPWGLIEIPVIEGGEIYLTDDHDGDLGTIFKIYVRAKRMYAQEIKEFFADVREQLRTSSIYRGKAIAGADQLTFIEDLDRFDSGQIVFSTDVQAQLDASLFAPLCFPHAYRNDGISLKRTVLLHGPYGTGKTSIGMMVAQTAVANGWTFLMARPGRDNVQDVLRTARLYAPAVVFVEDLDTDTNTSDPKAISAMLDAFDGITSKSGEIMVVMSTNHIDRVPPGMLRPGRLDYVIRIAELDRIGSERLIRVVVSPEKLAQDVDFDQVCVAMTGFLPAFVRATADRARSYALYRTGGRPDYVLTTEDLVYAARSLYAQLELHQGAAEAQPLPTLDAAVKNLVTQGVNGMRVKNPSMPMELVPPRANNHRK